MSAVYRTGRRCWAMTAACGKQPPFDKPIGSLASAFFNTLRPFRDDPYTPIVEIVDVATGQVTPLPAIAQTIAHGFSTVAWKPNSDLIAASTGYLQNGDLQLWLLDTRQDTASNVTTDQYAYGWAPDGSALVVGTSASSIFDDSTTHTVSAITFPSTGQPVITPLTFSATTYPYMGFVRSATS